MEENNNNPFVDAMYNNKPTETPSPASSERKFSYGGSNGGLEVNSSAESIINGIATVILVIGSVAFAGMFIAGLSKLGGYGGGAQGGLMMLSGLGIFLGCLIQWALIKVIVNISRNLFNIHAELKRRD